MEELIVEAELELALIDSTQFEALYKRYGFNSAEPNAAKTFNGLIRRELKKAVATAMINAENTQLTEANIEPVQKRHRVYLWFPSTQGEREHALTKVATAKKTL
jgi:hypothetical protein